MCVRLGARKKMLYNFFNVKNVYYLAHLTWAVEFTVTCRCCKIRTKTIFFTTVHTYLPLKQSRIAMNVVRFFDSPKLYNSKSNRVVKPNESWIFYNITAAKRSPEALDKGLCCKIRCPFYFFTTSISYSTKVKRLHTFPSLSTVSFHMDAGRTHRLPSP